MAAHCYSDGRETCKIAQMFLRAYTATYAKPLVRGSQVVVILLFLLIFLSIFAFHCFLLSRNEVTVNHILLKYCLFSCPARLVRFLLCDTQNHQLLLQE